MTLWRSRLWQWLLWRSPAPEPVGASSGPETRKHGQLSSTELYKPPPSLPPSDRVVASQILTGKSPQHMLPPELCLGEYLEEYQVTWSNSCQGKLKSKYCRWWHAQPHGLVWFRLSEELYWQNTATGVAVEPENLIWIPCHHLCVRFMPLWLVLPGKSVVNHTKLVLLSVVFMLNKIFFLCKNALFFGYSHSKS